MLFLLLWCFVCSFSRSSSRSYVHINWVYGNHICHSALDIYINQTGWYHISLFQIRFTDLDPPCFNASTVSDIRGDLVSVEWNIVSLTLLETQNAFPNNLSMLFSRWISFDKFSTNRISFQLLSFAHVTSDASALLTYPDTFHGVTWNIFDPFKVQSKIRLLDAHLVDSENSYQKVSITFWYIVIFSPLVSVEVFLLLWRYVISGFNWKNKTLSPHNIYLVQLVKTPSSCHF